MGSVPSRACSMTLTAELLIPTPTLMVLSDASFRAETLCDFRSCSGTPLHPYSVDQDRWYFSGGSYEPFQCQTEYFQSNGTLLKLKRTSYKSKKTSSALT